MRAHRVRRGAARPQPQVDACTASVFSPLGTDPFAFPNELALAGTYTSLTTAPSALSCLGCPAGSYSNAGSASCTACAAGTWSSSLAGACTQCAAGTFSAATSQTSAAACAACNPGYSSNAGASACTLCAPGYYGVVSSPNFIGCTPCAQGYISTAAGAASCTACTQGSSSLPASTTCSACPKGSYGPSAGSLCVPCAPGSYQGANGASTCNSCSAGSYCPQGAQDSLTVCPAGVYCPGSFAAPQPCPSGTWRSATGGILLSDCTQCTAGTYSSTVGATSAATCTSFSTTTLYLLRVGDGPGNPMGLSGCPDGVGGTVATTTTCARAAPVFLDTIDMVTTILTRASAPIPGITISANDFVWTGEMSQCTDQSCLVFMAQADAVGTLPVAYGTGYGGGANNFPGNRVVVRVQGGGAVDTTTQFTATDFPGVAVGVCTYDGNSFWVTGTGAQQFVYKQYGTSSGVTVVSTGTYNGLYGGCKIAVNPSGSTAVNTAGRIMYLARTYGSFGYIDNVPTITQDWTQAGAVTVTAALSYYNGGPYSTTTVVVNRANTLVYCSTNYFYSYGIYGGTYAVMQGGAAPVIASGIFATGLAFSPDETRLYITQKAGLYYVLTSCTTGCVLTQLTTATLPVWSEFRGVGVINQPPTSCGTGTYQLVPPNIGGTCFPCPAGYASNTPGAASCTQCPPGSYSNGGQSSCTPCPAGTASNVAGATSVAACANCPILYYSNAGAQVCGTCGAGTYTLFERAVACTPCAAGTYCPGGGSPPVPCPAGTASQSTGAAAQTSAVCIGCAAGMACPAGSVFGTTPCPAGWYCAANSAPAQCPPGTYMSGYGPGATSLAQACTVCPAGTFGTAYSAPSCPSVYGPQTLIVMRVGDGVSCPSAGGFPTTASTCSNAAPVWIDTYDTSKQVYSPAASPVPGITLSGNDYMSTGSFSPCADGTCIVFVGQADAPGTASTSSLAYGSGLVTANQFPGARVVARITSDKVVDTSTVIPASAYSQTLLGACAASASSGFWLVGLAPGYAVGYTPFGPSTGVVNVGTPTTYAGFYDSCQVVNAFGSAVQTMYLARTYGAYGCKFLSKRRAARHRR